jgi:hypothetical protein
MNGGCLYCGAARSCKHRTVAEPTPLDRPPSDEKVDRRRFNGGNLAGLAFHPDRKKRSAVEAAAKRMSPR